MTVTRRLVAVGMLIVGCTLLFSALHVLSVPRHVTKTCIIAFYVLWGVGLIVDWRSRKREPHKEPSPAQSASAVILATGAIAVVEVAGQARSAHDYVVPVCIAILTAVLAAAAFRFASKNRDNTGEARFDTARNGS